MDKMFILGGNGFIGGHLCSRGWVSLAITAGFYSHSPQRDQNINWEGLDIRDADAVRRAIRRVSPKIIINAAAVSDFQKCEADPELAWDVNYKGAVNLANAAKEFGIRLIHLSTDLVFDGRGQYYEETDVPSPICAYGKSKLAADNYIAGCGVDYCILRLAPVYGWSVNGAHSFFESMVKGMINYRKYTGFIDEFRTPISVYDLCSIIFMLADQSWRGGLFHVGGPDRISRYEFALRVCRRFGFPNAIVEPRISNEILPGNLRPKDCSMKSRKIISALPIHIQNIDHGLLNMIKPGDYT